VSDEQQAEEFAYRISRMIEPLEIPLRERALISHTLRYAYLQGYRDCNAMWTWQQIMQKGS
jgi:hypothetical protein